MRQYMLLGEEKFPLCLEFGFNLLCLFTCGQCLACFTADAQLLNQILN